MPMFVVPNIMLNHSRFYIKGTSYNDLGGGTDNLSIHGSRSTCQSWEQPPENHKQNSFDQRELLSFFIQFLG